jgi:ketosteroid isomerase-like protein
MSERHKIEQLLRDLYAARIGANLDALLGLFAPGARFRIAGTSDGKPIAIAATGREQIRPWLGLLVKTFRISNHEILSMTIEGARASAHWEAQIHSKVTGVIVPTEFVDLVTVEDGLISSYIEFFVPR